MPNQADIEGITSALLQIHKANKIERLTYLGISVISFIVLIICAVIALNNNQLQVTTNIVSTKDILDLFMISAVLLSISVALIS